MCGRKIYLRHNNVKRNVSLGKRTHSNTIWQSSILGQFAETFLTRRKILELYAQTSLKIVLKFVYILLSVCTIAKCMKYLFCEGLQYNFFVIFVE